MGELATCRYSHGKCKLPRATKKNGTLHTLCEYHRTKACAHQKKLDAKRRNEKLKLFQDDPSLRPHGRKLMGKPLSPIATGSWHDLHETENRAPLPTRQFNNWDHHPSPPPLSPSFLKPLPATTHYQPSAQHQHHYVQAYPTYDPSPRDVYHGNEYDDARYKFAPPAYRQPTTTLKPENNYNHLFNGRREYYAPSPSHAQYSEPLRADLISPRATYDYYEPSHEAEPAYARWGSQPVAYHS